MTVCNIYLYFEYFDSDILIRFFKRQLINWLCFDSDVNEI